MTPTPTELANTTLTLYHIKTFEDTRDIYYWNPTTGLYEPAEIKIAQHTQKILGNDSKNYLITETIDAVRRLTYIKRSTIYTDLNDIPLEDGIYNIRANSLRPYHPSQIFLTKHPLKFNNTFIENNPILKFLTEITESPEDALLLQELTGYCFYRSMPFQNFFILVGKGANGKSTFTSLLAKMLGHDNVTSMSLQTISEGSFELGHLYLKNANIMGDLPKKAFQDVGRIKELCGGDNITSKVKYKEPMQFNNFAKLISACNEVPQTPDLSDGFFRRAIIINFPNSFAGKENKNLLDELCQPAYLFDFFVKSIKAFMQALERGNLSRNDTPEARKTTYLIYSNSAMVFCNDFLEYDPEDQTPSQQLYEAYITWCREKKVVAKEEVTFFKSLYLFFGHKVWKKRIVDSYSDKTVRRYVIAGVGWRNPPSTTNSPEPTPQ